MAKIKVEAKVTNGVKWVKLTGKDDATINDATVVSKVNRFTKGL